MEALNAIACLHSVLRVIHTDEVEAIPGYLRMAKSHIDGVEKYLEGNEKREKRNRCR